MYLSRVLTIAIRATPMLIATILAQAQSDNAGAGSSAPQQPAIPSDPFTATVSWSPSTLTTSGTPLADLGGYRIYFGPSPVALTSIIDIPDPAVLSYVVSNLAPGTLYFAVTAYISGGAESALSPIVGAVVSAQ